jgi:hypothetical protein
MVAGHEDVIDAGDTVNHHRSDLDNFTQFRADGDIVFSFAMDFA